jgi:glycosyltransferase involved in cell wall biosynthesis
MLIDDFTVRPGRRCDPGFGIPGGDELRVLFDATHASAADQEFLHDVLTRLRVERNQRVHAMVLAPYADLWAGRPETTLIGSTRQNDIPEIYGACDVVVIPDASEAATVPALRAMAAGRAVVAADFPPIQDIIGSARSGMLARWRNVDEWLDKLDYLLAGAALRLHIGRGARARVETHFSLPQTLRQLEARLQAVAGSWSYTEF